MSYSPKSVFRNLRQFVKGPLPPLVPTTLTFRPIDPVKTSPELPKEVLDLAEKAGLTPEFIEKIFKKPAQEPITDPLTTLGSSSSSVSEYVEANKLSQAYYEQKANQQVAVNSYSSNWILGGPYGGPFGNPI